VDDGSPDACGKICDEYQEKDSRIVVIHRQNGGLSAARNSGLDIATGEFMLFVDSDDYIIPDAIERLLECQDKTEADIVQGCFFRDTSEIKEEAVDIKQFTGREFLASDFFRTEACLNLFNKKCFENDRFPIGILHEDVALMYKVIYKSECVAYSNIKFYFYRQRSDSIMTEHFNKKRLVIIDLYEEQIEFYKQRNEKELLDKAYFSYYSNLLDCIWKVRELPDKKALRKKYIKKFRDNIQHFISIAWLRPQTKLLLLLCYINADLWKVSEIITQWLTQNKKN